MKIIVHGPAAGYSWDGMVRSWVPDEEVEIDDGDKKAVAWARARVASGFVEIIEDAETPVKRGPGRPRKTPAETAPEFPAAGANN